MAGGNNFCHKCGSALNDDAVFCNKCGAKVPVSEVSAESAAAPAAPERAVSPVNSAAAGTDGTAAGNPNKMIIIIVICVTVVILGILGTVLAITLSGGGAQNASPENGILMNTNTNSSGNGSVQQSTDIQQNNGGGDIGGDISGFIASTSTHISYPELAAGQVVLTLTDKKTGKKVDEVGTVSTYFSAGNGYDIFCVMFARDSGLLVIGGAVKSSDCRTGAYYQDTDLKSDGAFIDLLYLDIDNDGYFTGSCYEHTSMTDPDDIKNCTLDIGNYSAKSYATYYIKTDFTFQSVDYTLECFCCSNYTASGEDAQKAQVQQYQQEQASGVCTVCHGSGTCQVCFGRGGMSYATYGQGGSGWVECEGCHGSRRCKYCGGTGRG